MKTKVIIFCALLFCSKFVASIPFEEEFGRQREYPPNNWQGNQRPAERYHGAGFAQTHNIHPIANGQEYNINQRRQHVDNFSFQNNVFTQQGLPLKDKQVQFSAVPIEHRPESFAPRDNSYPIQRDNQPIRLDNEHQKNQNRFAHAAASSAADTAVNAAASGNTAASQERVPPVQEPQSNPGYLHQQRRPFNRPPFHPERPATVLRDNPFHSVVENPQHIRHRQHPGPDFRNLNRNYENYNEAHAAHPTPIHNTYIENHSQYSGPANAQPYESYNGPPVKNVGNYLPQPGPINRNVPNLQPLSGHIIPGETIINNDYPQNLGINSRANNLVPFEVQAEPANIRPENTGGNRYIEERPESFAPLNNYRYEEKPVPNPRQNNIQVPNTFEVPIEPSNIRPGNRFLLNEPDTLAPNNNFGFEGRPAHESAPINHNTNTYDAPIVPFISELDKSEINQYDDSPVDDSGSVDQTPMHNFSDLPVSPIESSSPVSIPSDASERKTLYNSAPNNPVAEGALKNILSGLQLTPLISSPDRSSNSRSYMIIHPNGTAETVNNLDSMNNNYILVNKNHPLLFGNEKNRPQATKTTPEYSPESDDGQLIPDDFDSLHKQTDNNDVPQSPPQAANAFNPRHQQIDNVYNPTDQGLQGVGPNQPHRRPNENDETLSLITESSPDKSFDRFTTPEIPFDNDNRQLTNSRLPHENLNKYPQQFPPQNLQQHPHQNPQHNRHQNPHQHPLQNLPENLHQNPLPSRHQKPHHNFHQNLHQNPHQNPHYPDNLPQHIPQHHIPNHGKFPSNLHTHILPDGVPSTTELPQNDLVDQYLNSLNNSTDTNYLPLATDNPLPLSTKDSDDEYTNKSTVDSGTTPKSKSHAVPPAILSFTTQNPNDDSSVFNNLTENPSDILTPDSGNDDFTQKPHQPHHKKPIPKPKPISSTTIRTTTTKDSDIAEYLAALEDSDDDTPSDTTEPDQPLPINSSQNTTPLPLVTKSSSPETTTDGIITLSPIETATDNVKDADSSSSVNKPSDTCDGQDKSNCLLSVPSSQRDGIKRTHHTTTSVMNDDDNDTIKSTTDKKQNENDKVKSSTDNSNAISNTKSTTKDSLTNTDVPDSSDDNSAVTTNTTKQSDVKTCGNSTGDDLLISPTPSELTITLNVPNDSEGNITIRVDVPESTGKESASSNKTLVVSIDTLDSHNSTKSATSTKDTATSNGLYLDQNNYDDLDIHKKLFFDLSNKTVDAASFEKLSDMQNGAINLYVIQLQPAIQPIIERVKETTTYANGTVVYVFKEITWLHQNDTHPSVTETREVHHQGEIH